MATFFEASDQVNALREEGCYEAFAVEVVYPQRVCIVFRNRAEFRNWQNMNIGWDIRYNELTSI